MYLLHFTYTHAQAHARAHRLKNIIIPGRAHLYTYNMPRARYLLLNNVLLFFDTAQLRYIYIYIYIHMHIAVYNSYNMRARVYLL